MTKKTQAEYDEERKSMIEFRSSHFLSNGSRTYTTVWAPDITTASNMLRARYDDKWLHLYKPVFWRGWSPIMRKARELEVLQYDPNKAMPAFPVKDATFSNCVYGSEQNRKKGKSLYD